MSRPMHAVLCLSLSIVLAGCSALQWVDRQGSFAVAAEPITPSLIQYTLNQSDPDLAKASVQLVAGDSVQKCNQFLSDLMLNETGSNTTLDVATTALTATASAIASPASTIRGLAAAGSFTNGTKSAINGDFFAKASIADYSQAIQATYFTQIGAYLKALQSAGLPPATQIHSWVANQLGTIQLYHEECALGPAQSTLRGTLAVAASQQQNQPTTSATLVIAATPGPTAAASATVLILATRSSITLPPVAVPITSGETVGDIAKGIVTGVQAGITSVSPEIVATLGTDSSSVVLTSPASENITWSATVVDAAVASPSTISITVKPAAPAAALGPGPNPAPAAPTPAAIPTPHVGAPLQTQMQ